MDKHNNTASTAQAPADLSSPNPVGYERPRHIALFFGRFGYGGPPRVWLRVGSALAEAGHKVDCLTSEPPPDDYASIPRSIRLVQLEPKSRLRALYTITKGRLRPRGPLFRHRPRWLRVVPELVGYLNREQPDAVFAAQNHWNLAALLARGCTDVPTQIAVSLRMHVGEHTRDNPKRRERLANQFRQYYPSADAIFAPSRGVADDLAAMSGIPVERIAVIPNPAFPLDLESLAGAPTPHPWLDDPQHPVILGAGRIVPAKGFANLIRAFALIRTQRPVRLIILGGIATSYPDELAHLKALARSLGVDTDIVFPGYTDNPFAYMSRASLFVLSSLREGYPNVLIEAVACGCPVVSTDCPAGPDEILDGGRYGRLVPVNDPQALAQAALQTMDAPPDQTLLRARAAEFSPAAIAQQWLSLLGP